MIGLFDQEETCRMGLSVTRHSTLILLMICLPPWSAIARSQASSPVQEADAFFSAQRWAEAAQAYASLTHSQPANGKFWYRLGQSLLSLRKYDLAAKALKKSAEIGNRPESMFALSQAETMLGDKEKAFFWLEKALSLHLPQANRIDHEPNLAALRDDPRFALVLAAADKLVHPCMYQPEFKQFDFWVGEWTVSEQGQQVATSSVQRIVGECVVYENYFESDGFVGKSFNFYDGTLRKWRQTWVDGTGRASEFVGEYKDGAMRFEGESHLSDGTKIWRRMTLFNLSPTQVRQLSFASADGGKTWNVNYDYVYTRMK